jgi:Accessory gene regulator B.
MREFHAILETKLADGDDMIERTAARLAGILCDNRIIREEDREIIAYGLDALISTLINIVIIFAVGLLLGIFAQTVIFLLAFAALRVFAGGYHARTRIGCTATFLVIYLGGMAAMKYTPAAAVKPAAAILALASVGAVFLMAPIEHPNRPFSDNEYQVFKRTSRITAIIETLLALAGIVLGYEMTAYCVSLAMLGVTIILALAKKQKRGVIE